MKFTKKQKNNILIAFTLGMVILFVGLNNSFSVIGGIELTTTTLLRDATNYWEFSHVPTLRESPQEISCENNKLYISENIPYKGFVEREPAICFYSPGSSSCNSVKNLIAGKYFKVYKAEYGGQEVQDLEGACIVGLHERCDNQCRLAVVMSCYYSGYVNCVDNKIMKHQGTSVYVKVPKDGTSECLDSTWCTNNAECVNGNCIEQQQIYYRLIEGNICEEIRLYERDKTSADFETIAECYNSRVKKQFYRLTDEGCQEVQIIPSEKLEADFSSLEECKKNIQTLTKPIIYSVLFILVVAILVIFFIRRKGG